MDDMRNPKTCSGSVLSGKLLRGGQEEDAERVCEKYALYGGGPGF